MKFLMRMFSAFCVATVLAQVVILSLAAFRGNLHADTFTKTIALLNGIDISGDKLKKYLDDSRKVPIPSYEDVVKQKALEDLNLQLRQRSVEQSLDNMQAIKTAFDKEKLEFDNRVASFHDLLQKEEAKIKDQGLQETQRTLEVLPPEQSKDQILRLIKGGEFNSSVAILKGMSPEKRKKIMAEFVSPEESEQLQRILEQMMKGQPTKTLIDQHKAEKDSTDSTNGIK